MDDFKWLVGKTLPRAKRSGLMHEAFDLGFTLFDAAGIDAYITSHL